MNWLDILDFPDDFHVWKPTGCNWIEVIDFDGTACASKLKPYRPLRRSRLINQSVFDFLDRKPLKIGRVDYIEKVIYLELA